MAKSTLDFKASNAMIDYDEMKIIEYPKKKDDVTKVYDLDKIIKRFSGIEGLNISFDTKQEIEPDSTQY